MNAAVVVETIRRLFTSILFVSLAIAVVLFAILAAQLTPGAMWGELSFLAVIVAGAQVLGPEFSGGTLQLILTKPVNRAVYVVSRVAGSVLAAWAVIAAGATTEIVARYVAGTADQLSDVAVAGLNAAVAALAACGLLAFFGSFMRAYFNAAAYFIVQLMLAALIGGLPAIRAAKGGFFGFLGRILRDNPWIGRFLGWLMENLFPRPPQSIEPAWMLMVATNGVLLVVAACLVYRRREVPYGAD